ncbi:hypothetical protein HX882_06260 [Pseudomonas gingeri]|uniref:Uncharacterized protein n=1 Tax=Pseudomonas gingeri TaxID=117681 RepID=A0A7Y8C0J2_9PSED|nr:hypothetical protein [Pseudomonas gingeri]NWA28155.1 hypothetical protein [Pseudomonas gingeri]NWB95490.1 hypothetical protein [Pseudomonas gingeri]
MNDRSAKVRQNHCHSRAGNVLTEVDDINATEGQLTVLCHDSPFIFIDPLAISSRPSLDVQSSSATLRSPCGAPLLQIDLALLSRKSAPRESNKKVP